jgi:acetyltransferase-like isoleucine patch superfamily enzyme
MASRLYGLTMHGEAMFWLPVRRWLLGIMVGRKLTGVNVFPNVAIEGWERLHLGDYISFNRGCEIYAAGGLLIGDKVSIASGCKIVTSAHGQEGIIQDAPVSFSPVEIRSNCWLGFNVIVLGGVLLPEGTIAGAGAVITKSIKEPYCTVAGVPAKAVKVRPSDIG